MQLLQHGPRPGRTRSTPEKEEENHPQGEGPRPDANVLGLLVGALGRDNVAQHALHDLLVEHDRVKEAGKLAHLFWAPLHDQMYNLGKGHSIDNVLSATSAGTSSPTAGPASGRCATPT